MALPMTRKIPTFDLADRLRKVREEANMSQTELADALGIGRRSISRYEDGSAVPKRGIVLGWALATGFDPDWVINGTTDGDDGGAVTIGQPTQRRHLLMVPELSLAA